MPPPQPRPFSAAGRAQNLTDLADARLDLLVVGGGITGAGIAYEATRRGYRVGLVEARDFAAGTSSRSSKLVHGGFRYLAHAEVGLVHEALQERRRLAEMFPELVRPIAFLTPIPPKRHQATVLMAGFWTYDALALGSGFPRHKRISVEDARRLDPALRGVNIRGAWKSWDAQTDDAVLTVEVIKRAAAGGALVANYAELTRAKWADGEWRADVRDRVTGNSLTARARYLVNAGGIWADTIEGLTGEESSTRLRPSKGVHLSFSLQDLPITTALIFPVGGGRVLFAIPWKGYAIVGTTDDAYSGDIASPNCTAEEEADLLRATNRFFGTQLKPDAVLSRWAGVRPLVAPRHGKPNGATKDLSRKPYIKLDRRGLLTVTGGKLTTFMRMAEDALHLLPPPPNGDHRMLGIPTTAAGADTAQRLPGASGYTTADVVRACDEQMALELEDALSRRLRLSFVDVAAARQAAAIAAGVMAERLGWADVDARIARFEQHLEREFRAVSTLRDPSLLPDR
jgi:glycerol-3-phosphate dehydrogenase